MNLPPSPIDCVTDMFWLVSFKYKKKLEEYKKIWKEEFQKPLDNLRDEKDIA